MSLWLQCLWFVLLLGYYYLRGYKSQNPQKFYEEQFKEDMVERGRGTEDQGPSCRRDLAMVSSSSACYAKPLPIREAPSNYRPYPPPLAKYQDVVADRKLFMDSLEKLHSTMGTKFMIPTIGGKELDLHRLFVEVTSRGGLEQVIRDRRWKEVTAVFNFPATATNASFVLRKYYISLLHHYEQIYLFGAQDWTSPPAVPLHSPSPMPVPHRGPVEPVLPSAETQANVTVKRRKSTGEFLPASPPPPMLCPVVGVIDGKFEHGYLVSVMVGTQQLKGVLYHANELSVGQMPQYSGYLANNSGRDASGTGTRRRRRRKKSEIRRRDPAHPKLNRSGYNFFFAEQHARLKLLHPGKDREISKMIGELWNKLTETEKAVYQEKGFKDKERYRSEMVVYRERQRTGGVISDAVPIQQRHAGPDVAVVEVDPNIDAEEGDSLQTIESDTSSGVSDSEEEKTAEIEKSPVAGNGSESASAVPGVKTEGDDFELLNRDQKVDENKVQGSGLDNVSGPIKEESVASEGH
ncbi:high mobility group B protein 15-like isoform X2 [Telopea speciosissima]|uniref:high mobility group B protein 15-like isoform X2 n=1 Tax=Telopea speciosissima TaxID=54955 RepID=UPI001CC7C34C|nr:high mobility group B protein 15-like isoform X2 [Telopea speciosissima]